MEGEVFEEGERTRLVRFSAIDSLMEKEIIKEFEKVIDKYIAKMVVVE